MTDITPADSHLSVLESEVRKSHNLPLNHLTMRTLLDISREIPEDANSLNGPYAEFLAGRFLKGMDLCGELYSLAVSYEMKMDIAKKREFADAMIIRAVERNLKTVKEKEYYAHADGEYIEAAEAFAAAKMFRLLLEQKKDAFYKAHYLMRKIADKSTETETETSYSYVDQNNNSPSDAVNAWVRHSTYKE